MTKYRMKASCGWVHNSTIEFGFVEAENEEEAVEAANEAMRDRMDVWVDVVAEDEE